MCIGCHSLVTDLISKSWIDDSKVGCVDVHLATKVWDGDSRPVDRIIERNLGREYEMISFALEKLMMLHVDNYDEVTRYISLFPWLLTLAAHQYVFASLDPL
jgi:hypothetical protein